MNSARAAWYPSTNRRHEENSPCPIENTPRNAGNHYRVLLKHTRAFHSTFPYECPVHTSPVLHLQRNLPNQNNRELTLHRG